MFREVVGRWLWQHWEMVKIGDPLCLPVAYLVSLQLARDPSCLKTKMDGSWGTTHGHTTAQYLCSQHKCVLSTNIHVHVLIYICVFKSLNYKRVIRGEEELLREVGNREGNRIYSGKAERTRKENICLTGETVLGRIVREERCNENRE